MPKVKEITSDLLEYANRIALAAKVVVGKNYNARVVVSSADNPSNVSIGYHDDYCDLAFTVPVNVWQTAIKEAMQPQFPVKTRGLEA